MNRLLSKVALVMCVILLAGKSYAAPSLEVPSLSDDATFVVGVDWSLVNTEDQKHIELYRNYQGGEFELIAEGQSIQALSQVVLKNGVYGYKLRIIQSDLAFESAPAFVEVNSPVLSYQLPEPKSRRAYGLGMNY